MQGSASLAVETRLVLVWLSVSSWMSQHTRCEAAEDHNKELRLSRDAMNEEMAQLKRDLAAATAEKSGLAIGMNERETLDIYRAMGGDINSIDTDDLVGKKVKNVPNIALVTKVLTYVLDHAPKGDRRLSRIA